MGQQPLGNQTKDTCGQNSHQVNASVCQGTAILSRQFDLNTESFIP